MATSKSPSNKKSDRNSTVPLNESWEHWDTPDKQRLYQEAMSCLRASDRLIDFAVAHRTIRGHDFSFAGHEYLQGVYADESPYMVIRKAAQMGASEYGVTRAIHFAVVRGKTVIYFFPTETDVSDFSRDRFAPAISESPFLSGLVRDTDTVGQKQVGHGTIYFRGMKSRTRAKSVPGDFIIFDEVDEMSPEMMSLARKRLGHSDLGWELQLSTPSFPEFGIDAAFADTDQCFWLLRCAGCGKYWCLEDEFLEHHGSQHDPRSEICFIKGPPGSERLVCLTCGRALDPADGCWAAKYDRPGRGYHFSRFAATIVSETERKAGTLTKPAALLAEWRKTKFPGEFFNSEIGLPYLPAEGGVTMKEFQALVGKHGIMASGRGCSMGVDQGTGLHIVIKEPHFDKGAAITIYCHHEPMADEGFTFLDHLMDDFDVRTCVIDGMPSTHSARAFAERFPGRVWLARYASQRGDVLWNWDQNNTPVVSIDRTEAFDRWRDLYKKRARRIPRIEGEVGTYVKQMTNIMRSIEEDKATGAKRAVWIKRGPDDYAHADSYAEVGLRHGEEAVITATILG